LSADANGGALANNAWLTYNDVVTAGSLVAGGNAKCDVVAPGDTVYEGLKTGGRVAVPGGVEFERNLTVGCVVAAGCVATERSLRPFRRSLRSLSKVMEWFVFVRRG
jgi:poly(3-hydroxybutyrate) depolymerase